MKTTFKAIRDEPGHTIIFRKKTRDVILAVGNFISIINNAEQTPLHERSYKGKITGFVYANDKVDKPFLMYLDCGGEKPICFTLCDIELFSIWHPKLSDEENKMNSSDSPIRYLSNKDFIVSYCSNIREEAHDPIAYNALCRLKQVFTLLDETNKSLENVETTELDFPTVQADSSQETRDAVGEIIDEANNAFSDLKESANNIQEAFTSVRNQTLAPPY